MKMHPTLWDQKIGQIYVTIVSPEFEKAAPEMQVIVASG